MNWFCFILFFSNHQFSEAIFKVISVLLYDYGFILYDNLLSEQLCHLVNVYASCEHHFDFMTWSVIFWKYVWCFMLMVWIVEKVTICLVLSLWMSSCLSILVSCFLGMICIFWVDVRIVVNFSINFEINKRK